MKVTRIAQNVLFNLILFGVFFSGCSKQNSPTALQNFSIAQSAVQCRMCHGNDLNAAPPRGQFGVSQTTDIGVGDHQAHVNGGTLSDPISCEECHIVPVTGVEPTHIDSSPAAEITWGMLATKQFTLTPNWNRSSATCSNVYCHGSTLTGGQRIFPRPLRGAGQ